MNGDGQVSFTIDRLDLVEGSYKIDVAAHRKNGAPYDYHRLLHTIRVVSAIKETGIFRPPHRWNFSGGIRIYRPRSMTARAAFSAAEAAALCRRHSRARRHRGFHEWCV